MLCFRIARETVARDSPSGANFGDLLVAVVTSKGERFLLSSAHYIVSLILVPDSLSWAPVCRCERVGWLRRRVEHGIRIAAVLL